MPAGPRRAMDVTPFAARAAGRRRRTRASRSPSRSSSARPPHPVAGIALDDLAAPLLGAALETPGEQLARCADVIAERLRCRTLRWAGIEDVLLDRVAVDGCGHPLALAVACFEAARRAGIELGVVAGGAGCFVAHVRLEEPLLVDVARGGRLVEATGRADDAGWQCPHQVAARILNRIGERAESTGNVAWALRAAELRLALPFAAPVRDELRHALAHVRARMNQTGGGRLPDLCSPAVGTRRRARRGGTGRGPSKGALR